VVERVGQDLQGNIAIQFRIAGAIHLAHAPFAEQGGDLVRTKARTRRKGQRSAADYTAIARGSTSARSGWRPTTCGFQK
jgi:hypothetical protein